jgi:hypothetical protein
MNGGDILSKYPGTMLIDTASQNPPILNNQTAMPTVHLGILGQQPCDLHKLRHVGKIGLTRLFL